MAKTTVSTNTTVEKKETTMANNATTLTTSGVPVLTGEIDLSVLAEKHPVVVATDNSVFAVVEKRKKTTRITLCEDDDMTTFSKSNSVVSALRDEENQKFTISNEDLDYILRRTDSVLLDLVDLLYNFSNLIDQDAIDLNKLIQKIARLTEIYSPEFVISQISCFSWETMNFFMESDNTLRFFRSCVDDSVDDTRQLLP